MDGGAGAQDEVDRDDDEPEEQLEVAAGGDAEQRDGEGYLAPAGGDDGEEAGIVGNLDDEEKVAMRDVGIVPAVAPGDAEGEEGARGREGKLAVEGVSRHSGPTRRRQLMTYPACNQDIVIPVDISAAPDLAVDAKAEEESGQAGQGPYRDVQPRPKVFELLGRLRHCFNFNNNNSGTALPRTSPGRVAARTCLLLIKQSISAAAHLPSSRQTGGPGTTIIPCSSSHNCTQ